MKSRSLEVHAELNDDKLAISAAIEGSLRVLKIGAGDSANGVVVIQAPDVSTIPPTEMPPKPTP